MESTLICIRSRAQAPSPDGGRGSSGRVMRRRSDSRDAATGSWRPTRSTGRGGTRSGIGAACTGGSDRRRHWVCRSCEAGPHRSYLECGCHGVQRRLRACRGQGDGPRIPLVSKTKLSLMSDLLDLAEVTSFGRLRR
jgi:hypothetical protein